MKKTWFLYGILFYSVVGFAKAIPTPKKVVRVQNDTAAEREIFSALNMKVFHDRQTVQTLIWQLNEQQSPVKNDRLNLTQGIFDEKDSATLEKMMDDKQIQYKVTPELLKKANEAPFEAFKDLFKNAQVPKITKEQMKNLGDVDKNAISKTMQMFSESGPDIGAGRVSVIYENETQN